MKTAQDWLYCISGALLFSFSMNVFLVPLHIYSAGFLGIAQLLRDLLLHILPYRLSFDIAGIINLILNIFDHSRCQGAGENICRAYGNRHTV